MEKFDIFRDIAERTGGDIYIGVVGPVRTGKSTLIKNFMELLVLPNIQDPNDRERTKDALPQSGTGRTITTTEPKFIPDESVEITIKDNILLRVRMVDCVGYAVEGAVGYAEGDQARMVHTPWFTEPIPFEEAAETGTRKVISDHSTLGVVVTTDGSITDLPRAAYVAAEERVVGELKELGKPFAVVLNTSKPYAPETAELANRLEEQHDVPVLPVNCAELSLEDIYLILEQVLYEFPVREVVINPPAWVEELDADFWLRAAFRETVERVAKSIRRLRDIDAAMEALEQDEQVREATLQQMDLGTGLATIRLAAQDGLFYRVLSELSGREVAAEEDLLRLWREMVGAKREYDKVEDALRDVRSSGYGMVPPSLEEMIFEEPELIKQGNRFGVRLEASAPSIHMIRADIQTEVTPVIGTERQCEELMGYLLDRFEDDPKKLWQSDLFGKPLSDLVREGIQNKLFQMPENARQKLQETLQRIINEGSGGLICIII
ncbi:MAG: stage IV sporulation protein A [Thermaerobacter sp.]|nr:stage IV sporulation protein A [Thermaerobacter sp.]